MAVTASDIILTVSRRYKKISLWVICAISLILLFAMNLMQDVSGLNALLVSAVYSLVLSFGYGEAWHRAAKSSPTALTRFYLVAMVIRLLLGAVVVLVYCMLMKDNRDAIIRFVIIFSIFYAATIILDAIYFARVEKKNIINKKK